MNNFERGKIHSPDYVVVRDYSGLRYGKITPTDIDGFIDFGNHTFVFLELKYTDVELKTGQRLALERLSDACVSSGKRAIVLIANYSSIDDTDVAKLPVVQLYHHKQWREPRNEITVRQAIDKFLE